MTGEFEGKDLAEKYEVGALIRRGEIGDFYRGRHLFMDRSVTLRIVPRALSVDDQIVRRFFDEAKTASRISHPNVLNVIDFGSASDGIIYAVYEGESGETLDEVIRNSGGKLDVAAAMDIAKQASAGLAAIHLFGAVHGNLTPENILVANGDGNRPLVKLFGTGSAGPMAASRPDSDAVAADFAYLAPEQCSGADEADARSDVYSLGVVAYEMLAGEPPFSGDRPSDVMLKHTEEAPPPLSAFRSDVPPAIEPVLLKALAKDPELRYKTGGEFADDLSRVADGQPTLAAASTGTDSNNIWKTAFIVLAGISLLSVFFIYATSSKQTNPTTVQSDPNGQPVQPINPATGAEEQNLAAMPGMMPEVVGNSNSSTALPGAPPGGDGYNPWSTGAPPAGAPRQTYAAPGGTVNIPPGQSPFMQDIPAGCSVQPSGLILCPVPVTTPKPTPTPKVPPANANTSATPAATPAKTPAPTRPTPTPATSKPPANNKPPTSTGDSVD